MSGYKVILFLFCFVPCLLSAQSDSSTPPIYERDFCEGTDYDDVPIKVPCVELTFEESDQSFLFLINTGQQESMAEREVIQALSSEPEEKDVDIQGTTVKFHFYPVSSLRLGDVHAIESPSPIALRYIERYKSKFGASGILGAGDMKNLVWDLNIEAGHLRVFEQFDSDLSSFPIQTWLQTYEGRKTPRVQANIARHTFLLTVDLLQSEDIQIGGHTRTLGNAKAITLTSGWFKRGDMMGLQFGQSFNLTDGRENFNIHAGSDQPYYFDQPHLYSGYYDLLGQGFLRKQRRIVFDLHGNGRVFIQP